MIELNAARGRQLTREYTGRTGPRTWRHRLIGALATLNIADRLTAAYLIFSTTLIAVCRQNVKPWAILLPIHLGLLAMIVGLAFARSRGVKILSVLSHWYPPFIFLFFFEEIGSTVHAIFPGWFDAYLIEADRAIFGVHPTLWVEQFSSFWLNEYMQLVYTSYFLLTIGLGAHLWFRRRHQDFAVFMASTCAAYYLSYVIFVLFPIESPHHTLNHLQQVELTGGPFTAFINLIEKHGRVHGGAFPSTHVAGAMVVLFSAFRFARRIGYWLTPLILSICVSTVYGRYHYVVDVFAGILVAALGCWIGARLCAVKR
ncbi:MAG TPA: phosphatase PAP2 family protein [Blastocatellia bacterium]|nr:phosphatase PAP2 family protein [Blastocatellia bacterium]